MALPEKRPGGYTYADYAAWPDEERWELIDGVPWNMSPAPGRSHQQVLGTIFRRVAAITDSGPCETYVAPFDVRLVEPAGERHWDADEPPDDSVTTVVQPDISVFCRPEVLDERGAHGAPDLIIEILSPSTSYKDQSTKLALYERHRVREYWIVNPDAAWVMVYRLGDGERYGKPDYYTAGESAVSDVLGGARIALDDV